MPTLKTWDMASDRIQKTIDQVCSVKQGRYLSTGEMAPSRSVENPIPVYGANGILGFTNRAMYTEPVTLVPCRGNGCGLIQRTEGPSWISNNAMACPPLVGTESLYLHYLLFKSDFGDVITGSAQPQITAGHLTRKTVPFTPDLAEQTSIGHILGTIDEKIELNRRMNATLEAMARALFQSWFVDFDPVRRNAEGVIPRPEDSLFPDSFEDSAKGEIPRGWIPTTLGKEADFSTGFAFKSKTFVAESDVRLARGDNVKEGFFHWDSKARYWPEIAPDLERYRLQVGDVLMGMDGSKIGKNWVRVRRCDLPCLLVQRVACLREKNTIGQHYLWILVSDSRFRNFVDAVKTGTSIPHISGGQIKAFDRVRPPAGDTRVFKRFEELVGPLGEQIDANIEQSQTLSALRDALLPRLLSGELSIP